MFLKSCFFEDKYLHVVKRYIERFERKTNLVDLMIYHIGQKYRYRRKPKEH
ncbi:hypothetical protein LINPERHAP1_LOCUS4208 [Linum perenne]